MLVDKISPTTYGQHYEEAICHATRGLIHEAIYWATDQDPQVEETECKAYGGSACEFRITFGD
jgi:predicted hydrocarbon binding protein